MTLLLLLFNFNDDDTGNKFFNTVACKGIFDPGGAKQIFVGEDVFNVVPEIVDKRTMK